MLTDSAGMAYQYTLAFYEQGSLVHLVEGIPYTGIVYGDTLDYYYVDLKDRNAFYEITLTPKVGNPDLAVSLNRSNMFPTRMQSEYLSEQSMTADSLVIGPTQVRQFELKAAAA